VTQDAFELATIEAAKFLKSRSYFTSEVRKHLLAKGFEIEIADKVVQNFLGRRFLDDERDARDFVRTRASRGWGPYKIRTHLIAKGVEESTIDQVLSEPVEQEVDRAIQVLVKARKPADRAKCARFLFSRGFDSDVIGDAVASYCREAEE